MKTKSKNNIAKKIAGVFGLRLSYAALTFIINIVLARLLGKSGFGIYTYSVVWAYLLGVPGTMGLDNFIVREIAVYQTKESWGLIKGLLRWSSLAAFLTSSSLALVSILIAWIIDEGKQSTAFIGFCVAILLMPALSLRNIRRGAMKGMNQAVKGLLPELLIDPLILLFLIMVAYLFWQQQITATFGIVFYGISSCISLFILNLLLNKTLSSSVKEALPLYKAKKWIIAAFPFMLIESFPIINARIDVLMLGAFNGTDQVGLYVPIAQGAQLITFIMLAVGSNLAPAIAKAYADGKLANLQRTITKGVRTIAGVAFIFAFTLAVCSHWYLGLFGAEFLLGQKALYIFCAGRFITTSMTFSYVILNMTGHAKFTAAVGWAAIVLNIFLNVMLIPRWGVEGAAMATTISSICGALSGLIFVKLKLGVNATILN